MITECTRAIAGYCLGVILGCCHRLAPKGKVLASPEAQAARDAFLLSWAMSSDVHEIALGDLNRQRRLRHSQSLELTERFGQVSGSIDARETLLRQQVRSDPSLFIVSEMVRSRESLKCRQVVAWVLKLAHEEISKAIRIGDGSSSQDLEDRLAKHKAAIASSGLNGCVAGRLGRTRPGHASIRVARHSKCRLHRKAGDSLRIYEGLLSLAPFALRRILSDCLLCHMGEQRILEFAAGLTLAKTLSIASGYAMTWRLSVASDGIIANVGPFAVGWDGPVSFDIKDRPIMIFARDDRIGSKISYICCAKAPRAEVENEAIRSATEALVAKCRKEAKYETRFEELPLANCAVVLPRFFRFNPGEAHAQDLVIAEFDDLHRGRLLGLAQRACRRANLA